VRLHALTALLSKRDFHVVTGTSSSILLQRGKSEKIRNFQFTYIYSSLRRVREESNSTIACYRISKDGRQIIFFALNAGQPSQRAMRDLAKHRVPE
jgi:hypothetical protein